MAEEIPQRRGIKMGIAFFHCYKTDPASVL